MTTSVTAVLDAINDMAGQVVDAELHVRRLGRLEKVLDTAGNLQEKARRKSTDLQNRMMELMDESLEDVFKQFDVDGNGTLSPEELQAAYAAAGREIDDATLQKTMKLLDKNGDGLVDLDEFKAIALRSQVVGVDPSLELELSSEPAGSEQPTASSAVLDAMDKLVKDALEEERAVARLNDLADDLPNVEVLQQRAKKRSKELHDQMMELMDRPLEEAFKQFDLDSSGSLNKGELKAAYAAAGRDIDDATLRKTMKLLDKNGDGLIDLDEFKAIALKSHMVGADTKHGRP